MKAKEPLYILHIYYDDVAEAWTYNGFLQLRAIRAFAHVDVRDRSFGKELEVAILSGTFFSLSD